MAFENTRKDTRVRSVAVVDPTNCTGCEVCLAVCPADCISMIDSNFSFLGVAVVEQERCTGCDLCAFDCPVGSDRNGIS